MAKCKALTSTGSAVKGLRKLTTVKNHIRIGVETGCT